MKLNKTHKAREERKPEEELKKSMEFNWMMREQQTRGKRGNIQKCK